MTCYNSHEENIIKWNELKNKSIFILSTYFAPHLNFYRILDLERTIKIEINKVRINKRDNVALTDDDKRYKTDLSCNITKEHRNYVRYVSKLTKENCP